MKKRDTDNSIKRLCWGWVLVLCLLFAMVGCTIPLVAKCETDPSALAKLAVENRDPYVRMAAVRNKNLTDQALLAKIAAEDKKQIIRIAAVEKLTDQALLAKIAVEDKDSYVRILAVVKLSDQALLVEIATKDKDARIRPAAVKKLTDQALLVKIAMGAEYSDVRKAAVNKLSDQALLAKISTDAPFLDSRVAAIGKVTDQTVLRQWIEKDPQAAIRQAAVFRIADDGFLVSRLKAEPSAAVRTAIIETLHGKDALRTVALTAYHQDNRKLALQLLKEKFKDPAPDVVIAHTQLKSRVTAQTTETDNDKLQALAWKGGFDVLRIAAAKRLNDPVVLEQVAARADDRVVLKVVLAKLEDKEILNRLASNAADMPLRLAAAQKSGSKSWQEIFAAATARSADKQSLGDALAAASLFPTVQSDAVYGVQQACLNLIRRGDESRIPEMVALLEDYGDKTLAEDYLNCGQPDLDGAGRTWAYRRGYKAATGNGGGSSRAHWGSGM